MKHKSQEKGQALVIIALAAVGLFAFAALAIDGSMAFSDKRHAQNAADTAALAGALAHARNNDISTAALDRATTNGYDDNGVSNEVTVTIVDAPSGTCPYNIQGKEITVDIVSHVNTTLARVIGRYQVTNAVTATAKVCGLFSGPPFDGAAVVTLGRDGIGFDGNGTPNWIVQGGGIFSNSSDSNAARCNGATEIYAPSVTVVGETNLRCDDDNVDVITENASPYTSASIAAFLPRQPLCNGTATLSGGQWRAQSGADGSQVAFSGDMDFAPGLYCVTNSPGPFHGQITGSEVTFYIMRADFSMKFSGGGTLTASAPTSGDYAGILLYLAPQFDSNGNLIQTQQLDLRGNGTGEVVGTIWAPSADVTMFGNSSTTAGTNVYRSQIIAYSVDSGGNANIWINYSPDDNTIIKQPITLTLLR
jgi:Flp pilus assembly protein TadG